MASPRLKQQTSAPATSRIPDFASVEEAAEFWDTHDSAEFEEEFEDVTDVEFVKAYVKNAITVQLDEATLAALTEQAFAQEIGVSRLIRTWVRERLGEQAADPSTTAT